jgi:hypothetical protein
MNPRRLHNIALQYTICIALILTTMSQTSYAQSAAEWNSRGADAYEENQWGKAAEAFQKAYTLNRNDKTIRQNFVNAIIRYSQYLNSLGDQTNAIEWLEYAIKVEPENIQPLNQLGNYLLINGDVATAIFRLEESIELDPGNLHAHFLLGEAYYKDNDVTAAVDQWEWVYKIQPDYNGLQTRLENALREEQVEFDFKGDRSRNFNVTYDGEADRDLVKNILKLLESIYKDIGKTLGGIYPPTPIQVSLYTSEGFFESTRLGKHVGAVFDGTKIRCPVLDKNGQTVPLEKLREILRHEYVHVIVHHMTKNNVPWWFNEGLAETLSADLNTRQMNILQEANNKRELYDLEEIEPQDLLHTFTPEELSLAYAQSHAAVKYLKQRFGIRKVARMLESLEKGHIGEDALRDAFGLSYSSLETQVRSAIAQQ